MQRREFLRTAGGAAGATAAAGGAATPAAAGRGPAALQENGEAENGEADEDAEDDADANGAAAGGQVQEVTVGPGGDLSFDPASVEVPPGTTVVWEWDSDDHNVNPTSVPEESDWEGHPEVVDPPNTYEHTFEVEGTYEYECTPHVAADMLGTVVVDADATLAPADGHEEPDPAHMGVLLQKHFIGAATFMGIFVTLVFTFYVLKYGESAHSSAPGKQN